MTEFFKSKVYIALFLVLTVLTIGVCGYHFIWDHEWIDALYMTIITVSTVGYGEVVALDDNAKLFTIFLIITSVFTFGYSISVVTQYLLSYNTLEQLIFKRKMKEISELNNHVIVCGYGRNGREAAFKLKVYRKPFLVIEQDPQIIERFEAEHNILFIQGDANEDSTLEKAGIDKANTIIAALPDDAENLFIVLTARQMNPELTIISRASEESSVKKLKLAGADNVVMPDHIGGDHMASLVVVPELVEFLDSLALEEDESPNLEQVSVEELSNDYVGKSLSELNLRQKTGCTVIGLKDPSGKYIVNPDVHISLDAESILIVLGNPNQIQKLKQMFHI